MVDHDADADGAHANVDKTHADANAQKEHTDIEADHKRFIRRAIELARKAAEHGNHPYGAVLVYDGQAIAEAQNTVVTDGDAGAHPELKLARVAVRDLDAEKRGEATLYASTEPCSMCAGAIRAAGIGRVVFSVPGERANELAAGEVAVPTVAELLESDVDTVGSVLREAGELVHEECWGTVQ